MAKKTDFNSNMIIGDVLQKNKDALKVFKQFGINCSTCGGRNQETIRTGAMNHGLDADEIVKELNKL